MIRDRVKQFAKGEEGGVTIEFVAISGFFFALAFMVLEIALAIFWWQTAELSAQRGSRYAAVWDPAVTTLSSGATNGMNTASAFFGQSCNIAAGTSDPCTAFATASCAGGSGGSCNSAAFNAIVADMQTVFGALQPANVTITYSYVGLGFVGGPIQPAVTVSITGVPFVSGFADLLGVLFGPSPLTTVPTMSVTFVGEDLSQAGA
jgi:Flp pilus assembly protein TadG